LPHVQREANDRNWPKAETRVSAEYFRLLSLTGRTLPDLQTVEDDPMYGSRLAKKSAVQGPQPRAIAGSNSSAVPGRFGTLAAARLPLARRAKPDIGQLSISFVPSGSRGKTLMRWHGYVWRIPTGERLKNAERLARFDGEPRAD
jgi:hypothetical protein